MDIEKLKEVSKKLTPQGLTALGKLLQQSRLRLKTDSGRSFGYRRLSSLIEQRTSVSVGKDTLQRLELGKIKPTPDTIMAIAAAEYVLNNNGAPYSVEDLLKIASEEIVLKQDSEES